MPPLGTRFADAASGAVAIALAGELARGDAGQGSRAFQELRPSRLEALYEMAYLRMFIAWEDLLEETFIRYMCGYATSWYTPVLLPGVDTYGTIDEARRALYGGEDYLLWHNPSKAVARCAQWFRDGIHSQVVGSQLTTLQWFASVRHRIAHGSAQVKRDMDVASMQIAGRRFPAASAGRFLRDWDTQNPMAHQRRLRAIAQDLVGLASQLAPLDPEKRL